MRTTVILDEQLLRQANAYAVQTGVTLTNVIENALREMFARQMTMNQKNRVKLTVVSGQGVQSGVDLNDSAALLDLMDGAE